MNKLELECKKTEKINLNPFKVFSQMIGYGVGVYVGITDALGTPINLDTKTKYMVLVAPAILSGTFTGFLGYVSSKLSKKMLKPGDPHFEKAFNSMPKDKRESVLEGVKKIAYDVPKKILKIIVMDSGKTALRTTLGYIGGYSLIKFIFP